MSGVTKKGHGRAQGAAGGAAARTRPLLVLLGAALLAGCSLAKRDSVVVGSIPDDYRTNHPIVISETSRHLDLPVSHGSRRLSGDQRATLAGFLSGYDPRNGGMIDVLVPAGSANELAASSIASDITAFLRDQEVPAERIAVMAYQSPSADVAAPVRVSYPVVEATAGRCGRWPDDLMQTHENRHYANFGCSYQHNLAAQVANPLDFLGPRKKTEIDAENRMGVIDRYKGLKDSRYEPGRTSAEFNKSREVNY